MNSYQNRITEIDALRGFALFGIIIVNISVFADPYYITSFISPYYSWIDCLFRIIIEIFFESKFYLIFSFLFGYSFYFQMLSANKAKTSFYTRIIFRCLALFILGIFHGFFLYDWDILTIYSILCLILLLFHKIKPKILIKIAIICIIFTSLSWIIYEIILIKNNIILSPDENLASIKLTAFSGTAKQTMQYYNNYFLDTLFKYVIPWQAPSAFCAFLFGLATAKNNFFQNINKILPTLNKWSIILAPIGIGGSILYIIITVFFNDERYELMAFGLTIITCPLLSFAYITICLHLFNRYKNVKLAFANIGRVSLSAYITQSLILNLIFTGYGFKLINKIYLIEIPLFAFAIICTQMILSKWWLKYYKYGPLEWLLRVITNRAIPK